MRVECVRVARCSPNGPSVISQPTLVVLPPDRNGGASGNAAQADATSAEARANELQNRLVDATGTIASLEGDILAAALFAWGCRVGPSLCRPAGKRSAEERLDAACVPPEVDAVLRDTAAFVGDAW